MVRCRSGGWICLAARFPEDDAALIGMCGSIAVQGNAGAVVCGKGEHPKISGGAPERP